MSLSIKILIFAILCTGFCYFVWVYSSYLRGRWQYNIFYPGRYIFPRRIKNDIRLSILKLYCHYPINNVCMLETSLRNYLEQKKINTVSISMNAREVYKYKLSTGEERFKYFLFIYEAALICGLVKNDSKITSNVQTTRYYLKELNVLVMNRYLKRMISENDRSILLAHIIHEIRLKVYPKRAYIYKRYESLNRKDLIEKHQVLLDNAINDEEVIVLIKKMSKLLTYSPIHQKMDEALVLIFMTKVCLLTKWNAW